MFRFDESYPEDKGEMYGLMCSQLGALTEGERRFLPDLANASALIYGALENINWAGFYLAADGALVLGPFQGGPACITIPFGRGVCGTAAASGSAQLVKNVHEFPGHIACDEKSNSEIVVPVRSNGKVKAVLDIDSPVLARFDDADMVGLTQLCKVLEQAIDWEKINI